MSDVSQLKQQYENGDRSFANSNLSKANLSYEDLRYANFQDSNFSYAKLSEAILVNCNFQKSDLSFSDLTGADLRGADLRGADLSGAVLLNAKLNAAFYDNTTAFPEGINIQTLGAIDYRAPLSSQALKFANSNEKPQEATLPTDPAIQLSQDTIAEKNSHETTINYLAEVSNTNIGNNQNKLKELINLYRDTSDLKFSISSIIIVIIIILANQENRENIVNTISSCFKSFFAERKQLDSGKKATPEEQDVISKEQRQSYTRRKLTIFASLILLFPILVILTEYEGKTFDCIEAFKRDEIGTAVLLLKNIWHQKRARPFQRLGIKEHSIKSKTLYCLQSINLSIAEKNRLSPTNQSSQFIIDNIYEPNKKTITAAYFNKNNSTKICLWEQVFFDSEAKYTSKCSREITNSRITSLQVSDNSLNIYAGYTDGQIRIYRSIYNDNHFQGFYTPIQHTLSSNCTSICEKKIFSTKIENFNEDIILVGTNLGSIEFIDPSQQKKLINKFNHDPNHKHLEKEQSHLNIYDIDYVKVHGKNIISTTGGDGIIRFWLANKDAKGNLTSPSLLKGIIKSPHIILDTEISHDFRYLSFINKKGEVKLFQLKLKNDSIEAEEIASKLLISDNKDVLDSKNLRHFYTDLMFDTISSINPQLKVSLGDINGGINLWSLPLKDKKKEDLELIWSDKSHKFSKKMNRKDGLSWKLSATAFINQENKFISSDNTNFLRIWDLDNQAANKSHCASSQERGRLKQILNLNNNHYMLFLSGKFIKCDTNGQISACLSNVSYFDYSKSKQLFYVSFNNIKRIQQYSSSSICDSQNNGVDTVLAEKDSTNSLEIIDNQQSINYFHFFNNWIAYLSGGNLEIYDSKNKKNHLIPINRSIKRLTIYNNMIIHQNPHREPYPIFTHLNYSSSNISINRQYESQTKFPQISHLFDKVIDYRKHDTGLYLIGSNSNKILYIDLENPNLSNEINIEYEQSNNVRLTSIHILDTVAENHPSPHIALTLKDTDGEYVLFLDKNYKVLARYKTQLKNIKSIEVSSKFFYVTNDSGHVERWNFPSLSALENSLCTWLKPYREVKEKDPLKYICLN